MSQKIRVAHIFLTLNIGGMEKVGVDLINNIDTDQFENYVICLQEQGPLAKNLNKEVRDLYCLDAKNGVGLKGLLEIVRYLKRHKIKVVHTNNPAPHLWGSLAAKICGIRSLVHSVHGRGFIRYKKGAMIEKFASKLSKSIVCVSEDAALQRKLIGIPSAKLSVVSNGVDTDVFYDEQPTNKLLEELALKEKMVIGSVARFSVDKDQETLIRAFKVVADGEPDLVLLLVGDGETKQRCQDLASDLDIASKVIFTGARSDVLDLLRLMDIYVLATHTEGLSIFYKRCC